MKNPIKKAGKILGKVLLASAIGLGGCNQIFYDINQHPQEWQKEESYKNYFSGFINGEKVILAEYDCKESLNDKAILTVVKKDGTIKKYIKVCSNDSEKLDYFIDGNVVHKCEDTIESVVSNTNLTYQMYLAKIANIREMNPIPIKKSKPKTETTVTPASTIEAKLLQKQETPNKFENVVSPSANKPKLITQPNKIATPETLLAQENEIQYTGVNGYPACMKYGLTIYAISLDKKASRTTEKNEVVFRYTPNMTLDQAIKAIELCTDAFKPKAEREEPF